MTYFLDSPNILLLLFLCLPLLPDLLLPPLLPEIILPLLLPPLVLSLPPWHSFGVSHLLSM